MQKWVYKRLDEACRIDFGTRVVQKKDGGSTYDVYGGGGATFKIDRYNREDCFIVSRFAMSPKCTRYVKGKFFLNDSGLSVSSNSPSLAQDFVDCFLLANNDKIYAMGKGAAQRNLDMASFRKMSIPVPPLDEQQRIVAELDLLTGIIDKQIAQLKELDSLAQSIFYDMFGDPIENEKDWDVKTIKDIGKVVTGNTPSRQIKEYYDKPYIEWIKSDNLSNDTMYASEAREYLSELGMSKARVLPKGTTLVTCIAGSLSTIGTASLVDRNVSFNQQINAIIPNKKLVSSVFVLHSIRRMGEIIRSHATNGMKHIITKAVFEKLPFILPPLALQQKFADKIQSIEKQKAAINQSIADTQKLLDYTMDKYFG